nr:hypothetical protein BaRGS_021805 [Batillaria attramentaria]
MFAKWLWGIIYDKENGDFTRLDLVLGVVSIIIYFVDIGTLESMYYGWRCRTRQSDKTKYIYVAAAPADLRLAESFLEAAPQLCFQLYVVFRGDDDDSGGSVGAGVFLSRFFTKYEALKDVSLFFLSERENLFAGNHA